MLEKEIEEIRKRRLEAEQSFCHEQQMLAEEKKKKELLEKEAVSHESDLEKLEHAAAAECKMKGRLLNKNW